MNKWVNGDAECNIPDDIQLVIADPIYGTEDVNKCWEIYTEWPTLCFMYADDLVGLPDPVPDQIIF